MALTTAYFFTNPSSLKNAVMFSAYSGRATSDTSRYLRKRGCMAIFFILFLNVRLLRHLGHRAVEASSTMSSGSRLRTEQPKNGVVGQLVAELRPLPARPEQIYPLFRADRKDPQFFASTSDFIAE